MSAETEKGFLRRLVEVVVDVRPGEGAALALSFVYFFCLLSGYYILRPLRDEMGVASGVENLQWLFSGTFVAMLVAAPLFGWVVARLPRRVFVPVVYRFFILNILIFYGLLALGDGSVHVARAFFIWVSVFNLFVVSVFWSLMADLFRSDQGRRLFGFIAAGGTAGGLAGPTLTLTLVDWLGPAAMLLVSAVFLEAAVRCVRGLGRHLPAASRATDAEATIGGGAFAGFTEVARSPYLVKIGIYIVLISVLGTFLYFMQATIVRAASDQPVERIQLFAQIDLAMNVVTILVQVTLTGRIMRRLGVAPALAFLPLVTLVGFVALALAPVFVVIRAVQALQRAANFAISNPAREVLFTVVDREQKYKFKNLADTAVFRGADMAAGFAFAGMRDAGMGLPSIAAVGAVAALLWGMLAWNLGRSQERLAADASD